jgi:hypothetical protein
METTKPLPPEFAERHRVFDEWAASIRDPAEQTAEGWRILRAKNGRAVAKYQTAPLPDGRWGLHTECEYPGYAGSSTCWEAFPTCEECVSEFLRLAHRFFDQVPWGCASDSHREARIEMLGLLGADSLFGFVEPEPLPEQEEPVLDDEPDEDEE